MSVFFVAGVHGVGKTTGCKHASDNLGVARFTASQIIRIRKNSEISTSGKVVRDLDENQRILVDGIHHALVAESRFLLDGHFTLRSAQGIEPIPLPVFLAMPIGGIAVFHDDPTRIADRLSSRDRVTHLVSDVAAHQMAELEHAHEVAKSLAVPITLVPAFDLDAFAATVSTWLLQSS